MPVAHDYSALIEHMPKSILVLPPLDQTLEVEASYGSLATLTRPLAEQGYYVFPVAVVDALMRSNGLPTPGEMHQVPLSKLSEIFAPDAVLYVTVENWGTSYQVINSQAAVTLSAVLIDADTGTELWQGQCTAIEDSGNAGGGLAGMIAAALINQVMNSAIDPSQGLSNAAATNLFTLPRTGLLHGPYHPLHAETIAATQQKLAAAE